MEVQHLQTQDKKGKEIGDSHLDGDFAFRLPLARDGQTSNECFLSTSE
jgi:hypothetical protein